MGLKESGLRGSIRNVSTGIGIPDSDIYLQDDWGDNKLQDRDGSGSTTHNGVVGVYRPEYTIDLGTPEVTDQQLILGVDEALRADININLDEFVTWEIEAVDLIDVGDELASGIWVSLFSETNTPNADNGDDPIGYQKGYALRIRDGDDDQSTDLFRTDENQNQTSLIGGGNVSLPADFEVTRTDSGEWELFVNDSSQGTETDTTYTDVQYAGFTSRRDGGGERRVNEIKVR